MAKNALLLAALLCISLLPTTSAKCVATWCSYKYNHYEATNCELVGNGDRRCTWVATGRTACVQKWGSSPMSTYGGGNADNWTLKKQSGSLKDKKCKKRGCKTYKKLFGDLASHYGC